MSERGNLGSKANCFVFLEVATGFMPLAAKPGWVHISEKLKMKNYFELIFIRQAVIVFLTALLPLTGLLCDLYNSMSQNKLIKFIKNESQSP